MVFLEKAFIPPILKHETIHFEIVSGADYFQRFMEMLEGGRTDAFLHINYFSLMYELKLFGKKDAYRIIPLPVDKEKVYCIFTRSQRGMRLSKLFDEINAPLFKSRVYDRLAEEMIR
ncbi:MAG: hypothetical protein JXB49_35500 [Bacteroidales bacterium]|nr:hypothetical protein [Bacteroidales bacterium]